MRIIIITNIPSPYRVYFYNELSKIYAYDFWVIYCAKSEPNRNWIIPEIKHNHVFLKAKRIKNSIYYGSDILNQLSVLKPDVIVVAGFNPLAITARLFAVFHRKKIVEYTDTWLISIRHLTSFHKIIRYIFLKYTDSCICASKKGVAYLESYGVSHKKIFISPLIINSEVFSYIHNYSKQYHVIFSGQFIERKMPFFFIEVCHELSKIIKDFKVLLIGDGHLKSEMINKLISYNIDFYYPGFIQQLDLPSFYCKSKVLLFPTQRDPWGIIANEACAMGLPVITCSNAGASGELIINNFNGYVLPLEIKIWVERTFELLINDETYQLFSTNSLLNAKMYNINVAIEGFNNAIKYTFEN